MWRFLSDHQSVEGILRDKDLAKLGDSLVNLCYSLAKSQILGKPTGEKVRDRVLASAIRATPLYSHYNRRTDAGRAADAYEATMAYLWLKDKVTIEEIVKALVNHLTKEIDESRRRENEISAQAFQHLLEDLMHLLPK
ncbi:MAG: hypothetical protein EAX95_09845 [Candidatus Thorarchaeota archaeon]|nr:hypothetical protein [Candidatus Thorarchaeota archaeon]